MIKRLQVCALVILVSAITCIGQSRTALPDQKSDVVSAGPQAITRNIIQDRKGNIWFAAFDGVFRYDGKSFTHITRDISSARFFSVLEDSKGKLWFGSIGSGVYSYDGQTFRNFTTKDGLINNEVGCIYEDKAGNIWFGVNGGVSKYDGKSFRNYMMNGDSMSEVTPGKTFPDFTRPPNEVTSIIEDKTGKCWFATRSNTYVYDGKTFSVVNNGKPFQNVRCLIEDRKGNIWLGGADGLWRYNGKTFSFITANFVGYIYEDSKGNIWTSSEESSRGNWVLSRYDEKTLMGYLLFPTVIKSKEGMHFGILEANDGSIWFGTLKGALRYDGHNITDAKGNIVPQ